MIETKGCIFCRIMEGKSPASIVYEDNEITAFEDINPQAPIHIVLVPKKHIPGVRDLSQNDAHLIGKIYLAAQRIAQEKEIENGFRIVVNTGEDAGQSVFHLHFHLLGGRRMKWPPG